LAHRPAHVTATARQIERAALLPLVPGDVPVAVAVVGGELGAGAGDLDDVSVAEGVVEPLSVLRWHVAFIFAS
jgi:hypothetical protein